MTYHHANFGLRTYVLQVILFYFIFIYLFFFALFFLSTIDKRELKIAFLDDVKIAANGNYKLKKSHSFQIR